MPGDTLASNNSLCIHNLVAQTLGGVSSLNLTRLSFCSFVDFEVCFFMLEFFFLETFRICVCHRKQSFAYTKKYISRQENWKIRVQAASKLQKKLSEERITKLNNIPQWRLVLQ
jgi:hypothetical protein